MARLIPVALVAALVLGWTVGCAGGGGVFRDRDDRAEAARLLQQRQADEEAALREVEAEAEAARERERKRALQAQQEAEAEADRRKREEAADLEQERRHRRERKEAEHDAELRELYRGSQAPPPAPAEWDMDEWIGDPLEQEAAPAEQHASTPAPSPAPQQERPADHLKTEAIAVMALMYGGWLLLAVTA